MAFAAHSTGLHSDTQLPFQLWVCIMPLLCAEEGGVRIGDFFLSCFYPVSLADESLSPVIQVVMKCLGD